MSYVKRPPKPLTLYVSRLPRFGDGTVRLVTCRTVVPVGPVVTNISAAERLHNGLANPAPFDTVAVSVATGAGKAGRRAGDADTV